MVPPWLRYETYDIRVGMQGRRAREGRGEGMFDSE